MSGLAVIFPGVGYTKDKPLLYYGSKILKKYGYEIRAVNYYGLELEHVISDLKAGREDMSQFLETAFELCDEQLSDVDFSQYDSIFVMGKSIGTVIGSYYFYKIGVKANNILITPLKQCFSFVSEKGSIAFCGTGDPLVNFLAIKEICEKKRIPAYAFENANHSLETGDIDKDIQNIQIYINNLETFLKSGL